MTRLLRPLLIVISISIIYLQAFSYPFVYDTSFYLINSPFVRNFLFTDMLRDIPGFVRFYTPLVEYPDYVVNFVLRPFCYFTFHLNYLAGGFNPGGYRLVNITIHALTSLLLYAFLKRLLSRNALVVSDSQATGISLCCAMLFAVNPIETEAVTYTIQRFTSLATCLYVASIYGHLRAMASNRKTNCFIWQGVSVLALVLGMLTKEIVFTAPIMIVFLNLVILRKTVVKSLRSSLPQLCCLPIIPLLLVQLERGDQTPGVSVDDVINIVNFNQMQPFAYLVNQIRALLSYFRMVLLPFGQSFRHTYPLHTSLFDLEIVISLAVIGLFLVAAYRLARRRNDGIANLISYFIIWFFVTISVSSSIIPLPEVFAERRAYLPSVGLISGLVFHLAHIGQQHKLRILSLRTLATGCSLLIIFYATLAIIRVRVWSSKVSLWQNVLDRYPNDPIALNDLGNEYLKREEYASAITYLKRALKMGPSLTTYQNLGAAFINNNDFINARHIYEDALIYFPNDYLLLAGAGAAYFRAGEPKKALRYLDKAIEIDPFSEIAARLHRMATEKIQERD